MNDGEAIILVCCSVADAREIYPGSVEGTCADCGAKVWVAPSGQEVKNKTVLCAVCGLKRIEPGGDVYVSILPKAVYEVKAWKRRN